MKTLLQFILFILPFLAGAQDTLQGVVAEENEKGHITPLIGVNVYWLGTTTAAVTDTNGVFSIACMHETHQLVVSYVGYQADTLQIENHEYVTIVLKNS